MVDEVQKDNELKEKPMSFMTLVILTGLVGGIVFSSFAFVAFIFNFTTIHPRVILEPWALGDWKKGWLGTVISIIMIGMFSIIAAIIYYAILRRFESIWMGIIYGIALFLIIFFVLNPIFPGIPPFNEMNINTIITCICIYVLFGLFIGYTISYEESEIRKQRIREIKT